MNLFSSNDSIRRSLSLRVTRIFRSDLDDCLVVVFVRGGLIIFVGFTFFTDGGISRILRMFLSVLPYSDSHLPSALGLGLRPGLTKISLAVKACKTDAASKACSSACSALLLCTAALSTLPSKLSSPFWFVGSVADGGVKGAGGIWESASCTPTSQSQVDDIGNSLEGRTISYNLGNK